MRAGVAADTRQSLLTMLTARGEFPEAVREAPAVRGSFDFGTASLREAVPSLRMTELISAPGIPGAGRLRYNLRSATAGVMFAMRKRAVCFSATA